MAASPRVAIVGGGIAGLTVARQLNIKSPTRSVDVEVFEASGRVGGVIETSADDGFLREHAANGALGSAKGGVADLASDLGIEMVAASAAAKKRWIYSRGKLRDVPANPLALAKSDLLSARGKLRLLAEPVRSPLPGEPTVAEFFRHRLGAEVHDRVVAPFVSGIYAGDTKELSMAASFPRVTEIAGRVGLFRGLINEKRRRGGGASSRQTSAPALGMKAIISKLAEKLAGRIRLGEPVASLQRSNRGVDLITASGRVEHFDAAVCAAPAYAAAAMFKDADVELAELLTMIPSAAVAVVHLGYRRQDVGHALDGFGFLGAPSDSLDVLGIVFESSIWPSRAPRDCVLLRCMIGGRMRPELAARPESEVISMARQSCEEILSVRGAPVHENVVRWPHAIAQYTIGHRERLERAEILAADQGVVLAGASYHGVAVNSVTTDASRAARRIHELLAAPLMLVLWVAVSAMVMGCSSTGKTKPVEAGGDGGGTVVQPTDGDAQPTASAPSSAFSPGYSIVPLDETSAGHLEVKVLAPKPPANVVRSNGLNGCDKPARSELSVHTLGGVVGAVVWLEDISKGRSETTAERAIRQSLRECRIEPRIRIAGRLDAALEIVSAMETSRELVVSAGADAKALAPIATLPMSPIGRGFAVPATKAGVYSVAGPGIDGGWVVVAGTPYIAETDGKGVARLGAVPAGTYSMRVWHPPVSGKPLLSTTSVTVAAGTEATVSVDLTDRF